MEKMMQILINDEKIAFSLENEKNLGDIIGALENWLEKSKLYISEVLINDDMEISLAFPDDWKNMAIEEVNKIDIKAITFSELQLNTISSLEDYFEIMNEVVKRRDIHQLVELADDFMSLGEELVLLIPDIFDKDDNILKRIFLEIDIAHASEIKQNDWERIEHTINNILIVVRDRKLEIMSPVTAAKATAEAINNMLEDINNISALLQTGKTQEAGGILLVFTEYFQKLSRVLPALFNDNREKLKEMPTLVGDINSLLEEVITAYTAEDYVTVGDVFEYEIVPRFEQLIEYIDQL
ncbi:hypothetical protein WKV44_08380 [Spirochaetia bacterium 38H-sp]|uniref:DUF8042 domain-containing protein n=1 Tax=Rarispira pelagica TaxID=3141764 RepID=A0ABU9UD17_9SPIR